MKLAEWTQTIDKCPKCEGTVFFRTDDGMQCFNCNHIIYYPADLEPEKMRCVKPMDWRYMRMTERHFWYNDHKEEMIRDYSLLPRCSFMAKWGLFRSTWHYIRKRWGVVVKQRLAGESA